MPLSPQGYLLACPARAASRATYPGPFPGPLSTTVFMGSPGRPDSNQTPGSVCQLCWAYVLFGDRSRSYV